MWIISNIVDSLLFYHRDVLFNSDINSLYETETEKSLRTVGYRFVEKYLNTYHSDYYDRCKLYEDYYDR